MAGNYSNIEPSVPGAAKGTWEQFQKEGQGLANQASTPYPTQSYNPYGGQGVAPMNQYQNAGMNMINSWAMNPNALQNNASNQLNATMRGDYMNQNNPWLKMMSQNAATDMGNAINQQSQSLGDLFSKMGVRYRGDAEQNMRQEALRGYANSMTNMYGQNYGNERNLQMNAVNSAMPWANMGGAKGQALMQAGQTPYNIQQSGNQFNYDDWLRQIGAQQQGSQMPYNIYGNMLGQMPLMYPQQQYNKGPLDYATELGSTWIKSGMGGA